MSAHIPENDAPLLTESAQRPGWQFGDVPATDEDWASPEFDYLSSPWGPWCPEAERERIRQARPYLIQHIRDTSGDPKWDPRGGRVLTFPNGAQA